jgi:hypothetical protein
MISSFDQATNTNHRGARSALIHRLFWVGSILVACAPAFSPLVTLKDATNDDYGPGSYRYPVDRLHTAGSYDLTSLQIGLRGEEVVVRAEIRGWFGARDGKDASKNNTPRGLPPSVQNEEVSGYSLQNIEIYIDTDANPDTGFHEALPGRGVTITGGWERAIWLSPTPSKARAMLAKKSPNLSPYVVIPTDMTAKNHTLEARFSLEEITQTPQKSWGYTVLLSGAMVEDSFIGDSSFLIRPVSVVAEESNFTGKGAPILDVWVPSDSTPTQEEMLRAKEPKITARSGTGEKLVAARKEASIIASQPSSAPSSAPNNNTSQPSKSAQATAIIIDQKSGIISLRVTNGEIKVGQLGSLSGRNDVYLIVTEVIGEVCIARAVQKELSDLFVVGAEVTF